MNETTAAEAAAATAATATPCGDPRDYALTSPNPTPFEPFVPTPPSRSYTTLKFADALAHLNEVVMGELERFEADTGARVATIKVKRGGKDEPDVLKSVQCHVRS